MSQTKAQLINAVDGSIVTADLADDAVTAAKLAHTSVTAGSYTTADITVDAQGRITAAASGTISGAEIADQAVTNAKVNNSAAIAGTKISPDFGSQNIVTTGELQCKDMSLIDTTPKLTFFDSDNNPDFTLSANSGSFRITDSTNSAERLVVNSDGHVDVLGNLDVGAGLDVTGAITASTSITATGSLTTNGNFTVSGTNPNIFLTDTNNDSDFRISNSNGVLEFRDTTNTSTRFQIDSAGTSTFTTGNFNTAVGYRSLSASTTGTPNTAIGDALRVVVIM